jgi:hypothetical protein
MPEFITQTAHFIGELMVPNRNRTDVSQEIAYFIQHYEKDFISSLIGYDLALQLYADLPALADPRFNALVLGTDYVDANGAMKRWRGIVWPEFDATPDAVNYTSSLTAHYVYYYWSRNQATLTTGVGEADGQTENATRTDSMRKQVKAYNDMFCWIKEMYDFLNAKAVDYPEFVTYKQGKCLPLIKPINFYNI